MDKYKSLFLFGVLLVMFFIPLNAQHASDEEHAEDDADEMFVHPFLAHMSLPDEPNEVSLRITGFRTRHEGSTEGDLAVHIEAGLVKNLGLHIRTEGIQHEDYSEVMLQYAVFADKELHNGISVFGQLSIPTGAEEDDYKGLFGVSVRLSLPDIMVWDGNVHYDPKEEMAEFEGAFVFRLNQKYYPILEVRGHISDEIEAYLLPAIKFRIGGHSAFGVGIQTAISEHRDYDLRALFTYDIAF